MYSRNNFVTSIQESWVITENWRCTIKWGLIFSFFKLFPVFHVKFLTSVCKTHTFLAEVTLIKMLVEFIMSSFNTLPWVGQRYFLEPQTVLTD